MARIKLDLPSSFDFSTEIPLRIGDINYGNHLGNDTVLSLLHEARVRFLKHHGWTELNIDGAGIIMADASVVYKSEAFYGDLVTIDVAVGEIERVGCDFFYRLTKSDSKEEIARAKTGIVFYNYSRRKPVAVPERFRSLFSKPKRP